MVINHFYPSLGGAERQAQRLAAKLKSRGLTVQVVTGEHPGCPSRDTIDGVSVYRMEGVPGTRAGSLRYSLSLFAWLWRNRKTYDILHCHLISTSAVVAGLVGFLTRKPVIVKLGAGGYMGDVWKIHNHAMAGRAKVVLVRLLIRRFLALSTEIADELRSIGVPEARIVRVANGVDVRRFCPPQPGDREQLHRALGLMGKVICVFSGRMVEEKGVFELLEVWTSVVQQIPDAQLVMLGEGFQFDQVKQRVQELSLGGSVLLPGKTDRVDLYLQAADLFVLPTWSEGMSNAILEAMAVGLPVITTTIGANPDVVHDRITGLLVPPKDRDQLERALLEMLNNAQIRKAMGTAGYDDVHRQYSLECVADSYMGLYDQLLGVHSTPGTV